MAKQQTLRPFFKWVLWATTACWELASTIWERDETVKRIANWVEGYDMPPLIATALPSAAFVVVTAWVMASAVRRARAKEKDAAKAIETEVKAKEAAERERNLWHHQVLTFDKSQPDKRVVVEVPVIPAAEVLRERKRAIGETADLADLTPEQEKVMRLLRKADTPWKSPPIGWSARGAEPLLNQWAGLYATMLYRYPGEITPVDRLHDFEAQRKGAVECVALVIREIEYPDWPREAEPADAFLKGMLFDYSGLETKPGIAWKATQPIKELRELHGRGVAVLTRGELKWPGGPERAQEEQRQIETGIIHVLEESYTPENVRAFKSIPIKQSVRDQEIIDNPGMNYEGLQRAKRLEAQLGFVSEILNGKQPTVDPRDDRAVAIDRLWDMARDAENLLATRPENYPGGAPMLRQWSKRWNNDVAEILRRFLPDEANRYVAVEHLGKIDGQKSLWIPADAPEGDNVDKSWHQTTRRAKVLRAIVENHPPSTQRPENAASSSRLVPPPSSPEKQPAPNPHQS